MTNAATSTEVEAPSSAADTLEALKQDMRVRCVPKAEARRRAEALGIRPSDIEWTPNPAFFDPMTKAHWTLVMAVAWIE